MHDVLPFTRTEGRSLPNLEMEILRLHNGLNLRPTVTTARKIGELLIEAKATIPHGKYLPWVGRLGISRQTASAYVQVAKAEVEDDQSAGHLTLDGILRKIRAGRKAERLEQDMAKSKKPASKKPAPPRGRVAFVLTGMAQAPISVEVRITDKLYEANVLKDDIEKERVWFESPADDEGWFKLFYSADGRTGDPWPIGKILFTFDPTKLDEHFGNVTDLKVSLIGK